MAPEAVDGLVERTLLTTHRLLRRGPISEEGWSQLVAKGRDWESSYRGRWQHDKVSTAGSRPARRAERKRHAGLE